MEVGFRNIGVDAFLFEQAGAANSLSVYADNSFEGMAEATP